MIINTEAFKKYSRVILPFQEKGNQIIESVFLDFKKSTAYYKSMEGLAKHKFSFTILDGEDLPNNFFVKTQKFFDIANSFDFVELKDYVFYHNGDVFDFGYLIDDDQIDERIFDQQIDAEFPISTELFQDISLVSSFVERDIPEFKGIFFKNDRVSGFSKATPIVKKTTSQNIESEIGIQYNVIQTMLLVGDNSKIGLSKSFYKVEDENGEITIFLRNKNLLADSPVWDKKFESSYEYNGYFSIKKNVLQENIEFLSKFYKDIPNSKIKISFINNKIEFNILDVGNKININKITDPEYISEDFNGQYIYVSGEKILKATKVLSDAVVIDVKLSTAKDRPIILFKNHDQENDEIEFLISRISG